jgi:N-acetylglutamate synthase-like GNAT family acetyltransferase
VHLEIVALKPNNVSKALCCQFRKGYWIEGVEERKKFLLWSLSENKVRGKIAVQDRKKLGWIDYYPRSNGWVCIGCIVVPKENQGKGVGRALVNACLDDCSRSKGVVVGATVWEHMPKGFFRKCGFVDTNEKANVSLMAMKFGTEEPPKTGREQVQGKYTPNLERGKLVIDIFDDGECPVSFVTRQLVKEAARDFGEKVVVSEYDIKDKAVVEKFGNMKGIFLDGAEAFFGYPDKEYQEILVKIRETLCKKLETKRYSV